MNNNFYTGTSLFEESDKSITLSTLGSLLTLITGGVLKVEVGKNFC